MHTRKPPTKPHTKSTDFVALILIQCFKIAQLIEIKISEAVRSILCSEWTRLKQVAQDLAVQLGTEKLQGWRLHSVSGQPIPLCVITLTMQKSFSYIFIWNFLCFSLCPLPPVMSLGTRKKGPALSSLLLPSGISAHR